MSKKKTIKGIKAVVVTTEGTFEYSSPTRNEADVLNWIAMETNSLERNAIQGDILSITLTRYECPDERTSR